MSEANCIFCKIVAGEIPAKSVHRENGIMAIEDINPQAPVHLLVFPERHVANIAEHTFKGSADEITSLMETAAALGAKNSGGFRLVVNTGADGGQTVDHLHLHLLGGRHMNWPPG